MSGADRGRESVFALPLPPNRTGGSPASGSPVSGCSFEKEHAFRAVPKGAGQTFGSTRANGTRLVPPPVSPRGHSRWFVFRHSVLHLSTFLRSLRSTVVTRFSATTDALTPAVAALRPARGMNTVFDPPPVSLIISLGLPAIPSPTISARPASCGCSAIRLGGLSPCRRLRRSLEGSPRRADRVEFTVSSCQGGRLLRTGRSRSIALHLALPRRSYGSIPHGSPPRGSGLPPLQPSAFSGALGQASPPAGSGGFQPRVGVRLPRHFGSLGQDAPKTGRLEACPTKYLDPNRQTLVGLRSRLALSLNQKRHAPLAAKRNRFG